MRRDETRQGEKQRLPADQVEGVENETVNRRTKLTSKRKNKYEERAKEWGKLFAVTAQRRATMIARKYKERGNEEREEKEPGRRNGALRFKAWRGCVSNIFLSRCLKSHTLNCNAVYPGLVFRSL